MSKRKDEALARAREFVCPGKIAMFEAIGIDLVIGKRDGAYLWDIDGHELIDCHINGGTYNLGHRNPEVLAALYDALESLDIGNHHFPSEARNALAEKLAELTPGDLKYSVFTSGGGEAVDVAIKTARHHTKRRKIVSVESGYHGRTGLSGALGDDKSARFFLSEAAEADSVKVVFNDAGAMENALKKGDVAAVIIETIPATAGFTPPAEGYLPAVKRLCEQHGALYIADEVQTGLGRTGKLWAVEHFGVVPDILVTAKGLSGGLYPMAATVLSERVAGWLTEDGFANPSTFGGAEIGCHVAVKVLEICNRPDVLANAIAMSDYLGEGLERIRQQFPDAFVEIRRCGLVMGLKFAGDMAAVPVMKALYDHGIWAIVAGFDMSVLQFKPILLADQPLCDEILRRFEAAMKALRGNTATV